MFSNKSPKPFRHLPRAVCWLGVVMLISAIAISIPLAAVMTFACICASLQLSAMWAVLGPGSYIKNSLWSLAACCVVGMATYLGYFAGSGRMLARADVLALILFPLVWSIAQLPYWAARMFLGWRIQTIDFKPTDKVAIKDIMIYMLLLSVSLTMLRFVNVTELNEVNFASEEMDSILRNFLPPVVLILLGTFLLVVVPAIKLLFGLDYSSRRLQTFCIFEGLLVALIFLVTCAANPSEAAMLLNALVILFVACIAIIISVLSLIHI